MREIHHVTKEMFIAHQLEDLVLRQIQLDRLTRHHNRLIKQCVIVDCLGVGATNVMDSSWKAWDKEFNQTIRECTHVEYVGRIFVLNTGWMARSMYAVGKMAIPKRTRQRIFLYGTEYRKNVLQFISTRTLQTLLTFRKNSNGVAADTTTTRGGVVEKQEACTIAAGTQLEKVISLNPEKGRKPGNATKKKIEWQFQVLSRDIKFSIWLYTCTSNSHSSSMNNGETKVDDIIEEGKGKITEQCIFEETTFCCRSSSSSSTAKDQEKDVCIEEQLLEKGEYICESSTDGLLILRWSNKHSWMRSNNISFEYRVMDIPVDELVDAIDVDVNVSE